MREILFRGMSIYWWHYGYYAYTSRFSNNNDHYKHVIITKEWENIEIEPETVGQYTWQTADWKKIFKWDIIISDNILPDRYKPFVVEYIDSMFCVKRKFPFWFMPDYTPLQWLSEDPHLKIIWNIYQHPHLIQ